MTQELKLNLVNHQECLSVGGSERRAFKSFKTHDGGKSQKGMLKYVVTNNFQVLYNTKEEAKEAFEKEAARLEPLKRAAFKFLFTVAPYYLQRLTT